PQGPVPVPLLRGRGRHGARAGGLGRPCSSDRPAPTGAPPAARPLVAGQGPGPAPLLLRRPRRDGPRPAAVLAALHRRAPPRTDRPVGALVRAGPGGWLPRPARAPAARQEASRGLSVRRRPPRNPAAPAPH